MFLERRNCFVPVIRFDRRRALLLSRPLQPWALLLRLAARSRPFSQPLLRVHEEGLLILLVQCALLIEFHGNPPFLQLLHGFYVRLHSEPHAHACAEPTQ